MSAFLSQGGYGFYIWTSYGISLVAIAALGLWVKASYDAAKRRLAALEEGNQP